MLTAWQLPKRRTVSFIRLHPARVSECRARRRTSGLAAPWRPAYVVQDVGAEVPAIGEPGIAMVGRPPLKLQRVGHQGIDGDMSPMRADIANRDALKFRNKLFAVTPGIRDGGQQELQRDMRGHLRGAHLGGIE